MGERSVNESFDYDAYRKEQVRISDEFEDYVQDVLAARLGFCLGNYKSQKYQYKKGENRVGIEIKRDSEFRNTGNLFIEIKEKAKPRDGGYVPSGIYRDDNSWLYTIGDERTLFIFGKRQLKWLADREKYPFKENKYKTAWGMLLPVEKAKTTTAVLVLEIEEKVNANGSLPRT